MTKREETVFKDFSDLAKAFGTLPDHHPHTKEKGEPSKKTASKSRRGNFKPEFQPSDEYLAMRQSLKQEWDELGEKSDKLRRGEIPDAQSLERQTSRALNNSLYREAEIFDVSPVDSNAAAVTGRIRPGRR